MYWGYSYMNIYRKKRKMTSPNTIPFKYSYYSLEYFMCFDSISSSFFYSIQIPLFPPSQLCVFWESILRLSRPIYTAQIFFVHVFFPLELGYILIETIYSLYPCIYQLPIVLWLAMRLHAQLQSVCWDLVLFWLAQVLFILSQLLKVSLLVC